MNLLTMADTAQERNDTIFYKIDNLTVDAFKRLSSDKRNEVYSKLNQDAIYKICVDGYTSEFVTYERAVEFLNTIEYVEEEIFSSPMLRNVLLRATKSANVSANEETILRAPSREKEFITLESLNSKIEDILSKVDNGTIRGARGYRGVQGEQGTPGIQGVQGEKGMQGWIGTEGIQGTQGIFGTQGVEGTQGLQGPVGDQGPQGDMGTPGIAGARGPQ